MLFSAFNYQHSFNNIQLSIFSYMSDPTKHCPHLYLQGTGWSPQDGRHREYNLQGLPLTLQEEKTPDETHDEG